MLTNKWVLLALGAAAGIAVVSIVRSPAFRKACVAVVGKGLQLKEEALSFAESIKEDAQDIVAEAKFNASAAKKSST